MAKFLTKKVSLIILAAVIAVGGVIWVIVANITPKFKTWITDIPAGNYVSGNGTASVLVDDYLYFVGDSVTTKSIQYGDNEYYVNGKMPSTGIYRVRISASTPVVDYKYDNTYINDLGEKTEWKKGEEGYNKTVVGVNDWDNVNQKKKKHEAGYGIEPVVPKIAGHDQTAMWVFGDYLIYTSPHNRYDNRGNLLSNYLDFFRVDLDGNSHTFLYTTDSPDLTVDDFTVWSNSKNNIYLLVHETEKKEIKRINVKTKDVTTLDSDVSNVVFPRATQYFSKSENETLSKVYGGVMSYVYYTKEREDDYNGNVMYRCAVANGEPKSIASDGIGSSERYTTFQPLGVTPYGTGDGQMVFKITINDHSATYQRLGLITNQTSNEYRYEEPKQLMWGLADDADLQIYANGFCTVGGALRHYEINGNNFSSELENLNQSVDEVLAVYGNTIYFKAGNEVCQLTPGKMANSITVVLTTTSDGDSTGSGDASSSDGTNDTTATISLPLAILYQPHGDQGDPMVFVQDSKQIRLYDFTDNQCNYLKFKES